MNSAAVPAEQASVVRLLIHVEGETEEAFVNEVLAPHLYGRGYATVSARLLGNARLRDRRGGIRAWDSVRQDIIHHLCEDPGCIATTMVDYYALPRVGTKAWPGRDAPSGFSFEQKAQAVEDAIFADVCGRMGTGFATSRFVPFVVMHEFEGLLFSDCDRFAVGIGRPELAPAFRGVRQGFGSPEEINDSPETAPSKRVEGLFPGYQKPLFGALAALEIGLEAMRGECGHFNRWLERLEAIAIS